MASKKRRASRQGASTAAPRNYSEMYKGQSVLPEGPVGTRVAAEVEPVASTGKSLNWTAEYGYVFRDLRQLGIVSVALLVVMLVIGFFL
mgnify:CR=1 FL=1